MRVFHGVLNVAGICGDLAALERKRGLDSKAVVFRANPHHQNHDENLRVQRSIPKRLFYVPFIIFWKHLFAYDVFHFYYGQTFLLFGLDLPILKLFGKKVVMTYCGSEIRQVDAVERNRNPYAHLIDFESDGKGRGLVKGKGPVARMLKFIFSFKFDAPKFDRRKRIMMRWQNVWVDKFFAYRNLYAYARTVIPENKVVGNVFLNNLSIPSLSSVVDKNNIRTNREIPLIIHAPTNELVKGSKYVRLAIQALKEEGVQFDYRELTGLKHHELMNIVEREADIVVDHVLYGSFGSLSIETMSLGKPVVCYVLDEIIHDYCPDLPIWNANIDNLKDRLKQLIENPELRIELSKKGVDFIQKYYDRDAIADRVVEIYQDL